MIIECYPATRGERVWQRRPGNDPDLSPVVVLPLAGSVLVERNGIREVVAAVYGTGGRLVPVGPEAVVCGPGERPTRAQLERMGPCRRRRGTAAARSGCGGAAVVERATT